MPGISFFAPRRSPAATARRLRPSRRPPWPSGGPGDCRAPARRPTDGAAAVLPPKWRRRDLGLRSRRALDDGPLLSHLGFGSGPSAQRGAIAGERVDGALADVAAAFENGYRYGRQLPTKPFSSPPPKFRNTPGLHPQPKSLTCWTIQFRASVNVFITDSSARDETGNLGNPSIPASVVCKPGIVWIFRRSSSRFVGSSKGG